VTQSSSKVLKEVAGLSFAADGINKLFQIRHVSELRRFYFNVAFIIAIVDFYKVETTRVIITLNSFPCLL
jgi:hypothetical protein